VPTTTPTPTPTSGPQGSSCEPETDCDVNAWCSSDWKSHCASSWLNGAGSCAPPLCKLLSVVDTTLPQGDPGTQEKETCVPEADCSVNAWCSSDWTSHCEAVWLDGAGSCPAPLCKMGRMPSQVAPLVISQPAFRTASAKHIENKVENTPVAVPVASGHLRRLHATSLRRELAGQMALIQRGAAMSLGRNSAEEVEDEEDGQERLLDALASEARRMSAELVPHGMEL